MQTLRRANVPLFLCRFTGITDGGEIYSGSDFP